MTRLLFLLCALLLGRAEAGAQSWPNEPAGSQVLTDWGFEALVGNGWANNGGSARIVADAAAPLSVANVADFPYPIGFPGGVGPDNIYHTLPAANQLYFGYWWKPSNPWEGHLTGINKISFQMGVMNNLIQTMYGAGTGPFKLMNGLEFPTINNSHLGNGYGDSPGTWQLFGNVSGCGVTLGQWHRVEVLYKKSTTEMSRDGILKWWLDGSLCGNYSTVNFPAGNFQEFQFAPTWGGIGSVKTELDHYWFDHVHLSLPDSTSPSPSDTQAPTVPAGLRAQAASSSQITLSWSASTDNIGVTGYKIFRGGTQIATAAGTSYSDTGLTASTAYSYTLAAYDAVGNASAQSSAASATTQASVPPPAGNPGTVTNLSAAASGSSSVSLSFTQVDDGSGQPAKYDIRYQSPAVSWGAAASVAQGACASPLAGTQVGAMKTCTVTGLSPSTSYQFQLVPFRGTMNVDAVFGALSNVAGAATSAAVDALPPGKPKNLKVQ